MTETSVGTDLLQALKIITNLAVQDVGHDLAVLAILNVLLSVKEPVGDLELTWVVHDGDHLLNLTRTNRTNQ